jgi:dephospho-CoA kinase
VFAGKPVIGIAGGVGSGKSYVAGLFAELGCVVVDSDAQVIAAYGDPAVRETIRQWWGPQAFLADGEINRSVIAGKVFSDDAERRRLEGLIHPWVNAARRRQMSAAAEDPQVVAYVWDTPLLFEAGLDAQCDAVVFVDAPLDVRLARVMQGRGWDEAELLRRQKSQWPLDKKQRISDYVVTNTADADDARGQVREVLSRILARSSKRPG